MKNKRLCYLFIMIILVSLSTLLFTGCQLALETTETEVIEDNLCGVFVTLGDSVRSVYHKEQDGSNLQFSSFINPTDTELNFSQQTLRVDGVTAEDGSTVDFPMDGYFIGFNRTLLEDGTPCTSLTGGEGLSDVKFAVNSKDEVEETLTCEATLYVNTDFKEIVHLNPVYQDKSGTYYILPDQVSGNSFSGATIGSVFTQNIDHTTTETYGDRTITEKRAFTLHVSIVDEVDQVFIKEMNDKDELIKITESFPASPEEFVVDPNTSYVIVEEYLSNTEKGNLIKRSIYSPLPKDSNETSNYHYSNFAGEKGRINQKLIKFITE